jgi:hypothetical protein
MAVEIKGRKFTFDDNGLVTFYLKWHCQTEDEALFEVPSTYRGLTRQGHSGGVWDGNTSQWIVDAIYKGLADGGDSGFGVERGTYRIYGEWREEPIETFPERQKLMEDYGGFIEDKKLKFPETIPLSSAAAAGNALGFAVGFAVGLAVPSATQGSSGGERNPMLNVTSYPVYYEVAEMTYVDTKVDPEVHREVGTVVESLPAGFDYVGEATSWLVDVPSIDKQGNARRITRRWKQVDRIQHLQVLALIRRG